MIEKPTSTVCFGKVIQIDTHEPNSIVSAIALTKDTDLGQSQKSFEAGLQMSHSSTNFCRSIIALRASTTHVGLQASNGRLSMTVRQKQLNSIASIFLISGAQMTSRTRSGTVSVACRNRCVSMCQTLLKKWQF